MNTETTSERLSIAVEELEKTGVIRNHTQVAKKMGVTCSTLSMAMSGARKPSMELLLKFCDCYPINFWWLRSGEGDMKEDKVSALRKRVSELNQEVHKLRKEKG